MLSSLDRKDEDLSTHPIRQGLLVDVVHVSLFSSPEAAASTAFSADETDSRLLSLTGSGRDIEILGNMHQQEGEANVHQTLQIEVRVLRLRRAVKLHDLHFECVPSCLDPIRGPPSRYRKPPSLSNTTNNPFSTRNTFTVQTVSIG